MKTRNFYAKAVTRIKPKVVPDKKGDWKKEKNEY
jgi:hypothetical protein